MTNVLTVDEMETEIFDSLRQWGETDVNEEKVAPILEHTDATLIEFVHQQLFNEDYSVNTPTKQEFSTPFISVEGLDGSGKTTAVETIEDYFNQDVHITTEPYDSQWAGKMVRHGLQDKSCHPLTLLYLFILDHKNHVERKVIPTLESGTPVISDRYLDSRIAYQSIALESFFEGQLHAAQALSHLHKQSPWSIYPETTIYLQIDDVDTVLQRMADGRDEEEEEIFENKEFLEQVKYAYEKLAESESDRFIPVDASQPIPDVQNSIVSQIDF